MAAQQQVLQEAVPESELAPQLLKLLVFMLAMFSIALLRFRKRLD